jgi:hypothetical protein
MGWDLLDAYSDYSLYGGGRTAAAGLSNLLGGETSHVKITRFLASELFDEKTLWKKAEKAARAFEREDARLTFDDTVVERPRMDGNEMVSW